MGYCPHPVTVYNRGHIMGYIQFCYRYIPSNSYRVGALPKALGLHNIRTSAGDFPAQVALY